MKELLIPASTAYLLCGLVWRPLPAKGAEKEIRSIANERGSSSFVQIGKPGKGCAFFATFNELETPRKSIYSLSALLAKLAGDAPAAVILRYEDSYAVVCINKSIPIVDEVFKDKTAAINSLKPIVDKLGITPKVNFESGHSYEYVDSLEVKLLGPKKGRAAPSKEVPKSIVPQLILAGLAIAATLWYFDNSEREKARIEAERLAAEREADPIPKYMRQLMADEPFFALTDSTTLKMLGDIAVISQKPKGWIFDEANCEADIQNRIQKCELQFKRNHGIYSDLKSELRGYEMNFSFPADLNTAKASIQYKESSFRFADYGKSAEEFLEFDFGDIAQNWLTAGLGIEVTPAELWPLAAGVPNTFRHPMAKMSGEIRISKLPLFLVSDLIYTKPSNTYVKSFKIKTIEANKRMDAEVNVELRYHVSQ
ncbi:hypothetical protein DZC30_20455 [Comamonas testosteroni]|uniref:Type 4b pilus protein PilO2 n=1 Tax=Comamonas testosteroni TaxID=285 RepID=A0A373F911_COMTE|nr:type 4b pilus protein PilO2 [Comamonas testosteroni]RGE40437.1 hypothetical protein DZC30_20455 [Comamonas testosteroni]